MSKTPICDRWEYDSYSGGLVVPLNVAKDLETELAEARADVKDRDNALAAIMAVLPDSAKPCDAPDLIKHFKSQMLAFSSEYIRIEKQLKEARAEIDELTLMATNASMEPARRLIQKNKELHAVIEQMREALRLALPEARSTHVEQTILAALAAERGLK